MCSPTLPTMLQKPKSTSPWFTPAKLLEWTLGPALPGPPARPFLWRIVMTYRFLDIAGTPSVRAAQIANGSGDFWNGFKGHRDFDQFTEAETQFIAASDSFYIATVSESGWPYVQHRGGPAGFLRVLDDKTLAFADFRGNRQYISVGNLAANDRASL